jgi:catechol 2,3-dioxygenase-like lactoylglutathione lyase family enzyme
MKTILLTSLLTFVINLSCFGQNKKDTVMEQRLSIVTLGVTDLKISIDFYTNKFGWKQVDSGNENIAFFQLNGIQLALYSKDKLAEDATISPTGSGFKGFSLSYNARSENEVDYIISKVREKGVKIVKNPQKVFWGGYSSYISDPDDNLWEIAFNPYLQIDQQGNIK